MLVLSKNNFEWEKAEVSFVFCKNLYFEGKIDKYIRKGKRNAISAKELSFFVVVMLVIQKER